MQRISQAAKTMLLETILPFWKNLRDDTYGGYYGYLDFDLKLDEKAEKGCILNSRILWFFASAAMLTGRADLAAEADHAYDFLAQHCYDSANGGMYWSVTYDGKPADTTKHTYNQAFAIYALSAYYRLTGNRHALQLAENLFDTIEKHCTDAEGYLEAFTVDWKPESNEKLSENGVMAAKTMNTLLHVFEGYSGLYEAEKLPRVEKALRRILDIYAGKIYNPALRRQEVFFDAHYHTILDLHSYGHDIESSWLIEWGCALLGDDVLLKKIQTIDSAMAQNILETAYQKHSLCNECDRGKVDTTRVWWVQAEAVMGFVNEYQKHPEHTEFRDAAAEIWQYIETKMVDKRPGSEWFWDLDENGEPASRKPIVEPWKCPYHNGRMCMELIRRDPDVTVES
jgi:mannobiose 2-epimerase